MVVYPNAKINIGLYVTGKREDGFHNLETIYYPVGIKDILEINRINSAQGVCVFENTGLPINCPDDKNLVVRAYKMLASAFSLPAIEVRLHKVIPYGAGLGGGSADAAFMLQALNAYFELKIPERNLLNYAARLGSDCSFFLKNRPLFAGGTGNEFEETELLLNDYTIMVVKPDCGVSTTEAYASVTPSAPSFNLRHLNELPIEQWKEYIRNDFEEQAFGRYPEIKRIKEALYNMGALYASMTGSGSGVFGIFKKGEGKVTALKGEFVWKSE